MNVEEAVKFRKELEKYMKEQAETLGFDKKTGSDLVERYIEIYPDKGPMMELIDLNQKGSFSVKPGNILVNQKAFLLAAVEWALSFGLPDSLLNCIQLYLLSAVAIYKSLKVDLDENESYIVLYLHKNQMYEQGEDEETFLKKFKVWYRNQTGDELSDIRLNRAVDNLLKIKTIVIEEGKVRLQERVWHNKLS